MHQPQVSQPTDFLTADQWLFFLQELKLKGSELHLAGEWPAWQLQACGWLGVYRWFASRTDDGWGWSEADVIRGYLALSHACLTTAFIVTQRTGAMKRISASCNEAARARWMPGLVSGEIFGTIGISHLTTSQQNRGQPSLIATPRAGGFELNGSTPWVTGAAHAQVIVVGASTETGDQAMFAVPRDTRGLTLHSGKPLVALTSSCTDRVEFDHVLVSNDDLLDGPAKDLMVTGKGGSTGGLQTSTLAVGLAKSAVEFLSEQAQARRDLAVVADKLESDIRSLEHLLLDAAQGHPECSLQSIRKQANMLVLRCTQAALTVAKGTGFTEGHPAGIWARQALFFLVWSCPQDVAHASLCELAGLKSISLDPTY